MTKRDTTNAVATPIASIRSSHELTVYPLLKRRITFTEEAPIISGNASKKENSALVARERTQAIPPMVVAPERDVPGISERT